MAQAGYGAYGMLIVEESTTSLAYMTANQKLFFSGSVDKLMVIGTDDGGTIYYMNGQTTAHYYMVR
jgi:hypothetical protein